MKKLLSLILLFLCVDAFGAGLTVSTTNGYSTNQSLATPYGTNFHSYGNFRYDRNHTNEWYQFFGSQQWGIGNSNVNSSFQPFIINRTGVVGFSNITALTVTADQYIGIATNSGSDGDVLSKTGSNFKLVPQSGGSQTPLASDINGADFSLTNLGNLSINGEAVIKSGELEFTNTTATNTVICLMTRSNQNTIIQWMNPDGTTNQVIGLIQNTNDLKYPSDPNGLAPLFVYTSGRKYNQTNADVYVTSDGTWYFHKGIFVANGVANIDNSGNYFGNEATFTTVFTGDTIDFGTGGADLHSMGIASRRDNLTSPSSLTFPSSGDSWTNELDCNIEVYIDNFGVTGTSLNKNGAQICGGVPQFMSFGLQPGEYFSETYTIGTPSATYSPQ